MAKRINSRAKGAQGERLARDYLHQLGFTGARRGQQFSGSPDSPDVVCADLPNVHLEVKRVSGMDLGTKLLDDACEQAITDAGPREWAVLWRGNRQKWRMTFTTGCGHRATVCGDGEIKRALTWLNDMEN